LDRAMGLKGLPQGFITELIGPEGLGGISLAARIAAKAQRRQYDVMIIDMPATFDPDHASICGLAAPELLRYLPQTAFELIDLLEQTASEPGLVILNLGFVPQTFASATPGVLNALLHRIYQITNKSERAIFVVTVMEKDDPFIHLNYPPGFPLNTVADIRLWLQDEGWSKRKGQINGYRGNVTVIQNRLAPTGKGAVLRIPFNDPQALEMEADLGF